MKSKKPAKSSANNLFSKLQWLMFFRVVVVTLLLGATAIWQLQEREYFRYASLTPLYFLIGFTYGLTLLYALLLRRIQELKTFAYAQVLGDVFFVTLLIYFTGGIDSIFSWVYLLAIFSASTILYRRGGLLIASVSSILYGTLLDLEYYQVISSPGARLLQEPSYPSSYVFYLIAMNLVAFYLVALLSAYLAEQVRQKEEELTRRLIDYRQLEQLYKLIVQNVTSGLVTVDEQGRVTSFNHMAEDITDFKLEEVYHLKIGSLFRGIMEQHRNRGESPESGWENLCFSRWETKFTKKDGAVLTLGFSASPLKNSQDQTIGSIIIFQDLSKLREMEEELKRADRLAAIGGLAAGLAHEIRNPLASISGSIEILKEERGNNPQKLRLMDIVLREVSRLNSLVEDFLLFARPSFPRKERIHLNRVVEEIIKIFTNNPDYSSGVKITNESKDDLFIQGDAQQIKQVFWNLIINAAQAMPSGGEVRVELRKNSSLPLFPGLSQGEILISDTGVGIKEEDMGRIFDPFFSTKEDGTGLGLSIVHRIVEGHGGKVTVRSQLGQGTSFTLYFSVEGPSLSAD